MPNAKQLIYTYVWTVATVALLAAVLSMLNPAPVVMYRCVEDSGPPCVWNCQVDGNGWCT